MKKKIFVLLSLLMLFCICFWLTACKEDDKEKPAVEYVDTDLFKKTPESAKTIYSIAEKNMTAQEAEMIVSLQGIVAKRSPAIHIQTTTESSDWLTKCASQYGIKVEKISNAWELLSLFQSEITGGKYVLYTSTSEPGASYYEQSVNYATSVSAAEGYLMVSTSLESAARRAGLTLGKDVRTSNTEAIFNEYKNRLSNDALVHQAPSKWQLRDYAIAKGLMCYYSDFYDGTGVKDEILSWADSNAPIYGWTENETNFVTSNSLHKKITIAADWSANLSLYASFSSRDTYAQTNTAAPAKEKKHYVAIVMSDGDNLQWMENGFATDSKYFGSEYRGDFPMTWTVAPSLINLAPQILNYLYDNASANDQFIAGPSGVGYVNLTDYNADARASYAALTASYMKATDMQYVNLLDGGVDVSALAELSQYDSVKGGVWSVGNLYIEGGGGVYWSNGKPFVCVRDTLWRVAGDDYGNQYYGFVERVAQRVNSYKVDPDSIEGYTVIVAHAWSVGSMDYISRFVELLDEDVELVTVGQLVDLVAQNVPQKDVDTLNDISPEDITDLCPISSEQYHAEQIERLRPDENRSFLFSETGASLLYKWKFGDGGLQYDYAGYGTDGIKLDGSDLNDVIDPLPNSWTVNKFTLTEDDRYLTVFASVAAGSDANFRVRILQVVDGKLVAQTLISPEYEKETDGFGWYKAEGTSPGKYTYDLSSFIGKTVAVSVEQDDTGDGSGEIITVQRIIIGEKNNSSSVSWDIDGLITDWTREGTVTSHTEGLCLEYGSSEASISNTVAVSETAKYLTIAFRKFVRDGTQDDNPKIRLFVNGELLRALGKTVDEVTALTDEYTQYCYDLTAYIGQTVTVRLTSIAGQHACFNRIYLDATEEIETEAYPSEQYRASALSLLTSATERSWSGEELANWNGAYGTGEYDNAELIFAGGGSTRCLQLEGSDMGRANDYLPNAWIYQQLTLSEPDRCLHLRVRSADDADTNLRVRVLRIVNGAIVSQALVSPSYNHAPDGYGYFLIGADSGETFDFDLTAYAGQTVILSIEQDDNGEGSGEYVNLFEISITQTIVTP